MAIPVQQQPEVGLRPLGAPQINVDSRGAFGEAIVQGLQQAGHGVQNLAEGMQAQKEKADSTWALNAENEWHTVASQMSSQVMQAQGQDAAAISADRTDKIRKAREKIIGSANNAQQAALFQMRTSRAQDQYEAQIEGHVAQQTDIAVGKSADALAAGNLDRIAQNYANPELVATLQIGAESALRNATAKYGAAYSDQVVNDYRQKSAKVVMNGYLGAEDAKGAKDAYAVLKDQLGTDGPQFEHHVKLLERQQGAIADARAITSAPDAYLPGTKILNADQAMKKFMALPTTDPERLSQTRKLLNDEMQMNHTASQMNNATAFNQLLTAYQRGAPKPVAAEAFLLNPNNVGGGSAYQDYLNIIKSTENQDYNAKPTPEQSAAFSALEWSIYSDPGHYAQFNRVEDFHKGDFDKKGSLASQLTPRQLELADHMLAGIKGEMTNVAKKDLTADQKHIVHDLMKKANLLPQTNSATPSTKQQLQFSYVLDDVRDKYIAWKQTPENAKTEPTTEMIQSWVLPHIQEGVVLDSGVWNDTPRAVEVSRDVDKKWGGKVFVPKDMLPEIDAKLKEEGRKITDTTRADMFKERFANRRFVPQNMLPAVDELIRKHGDTPTAALRADVYAQLVPEPVQRRSGDSGRVSLPSDGAPFIPPSAVPPDPTLRSGPAPMPYFQPPTQDGNPPPINFSQPYTEQQPPSGGGQ